MKVYIISYRLQSKKDYTGLYEQLEALPDWWHYLESTWLVATEQNANQLYNLMRPHLDQEKDDILIIQAGTDMQGWLPKDAWEWIHRNFLGLTV